MAIVVCIKQIPNDVAAAADKQGRIERQMGRFCLNPADYYALEAALRMKKQTGDTVIALSMGTMKSEEVLREAAAIGADEIILVSDKIFAGSDTQATSYILSMAVKKIGNVRAVFCGKQSKDGDTGQIGPEMAEKLGFFLVTNALQIEYQNTDRFSYVRQLNGGYTKGNGQYPVVFTVNRMIGECRVATINGIIKAKKIQLHVWDNNILGADEKKCGRTGSPTYVAKVYNSERMNRAQKEWKGTAADIAEKIFEAVKQHKTIFKPQRKSYGLSDSEVDEYECTMDEIEETGGICIFAESENNQVSEAVFQLIGHMRSLINGTEQKVMVLYVGEEMPSDYKLMFGSGAEGIYWFAYNLRPVGNEPSYAAVLEQAVNRMKPLVVLFAATEFGKTLAALLASRLGTGLTADCIGLSYDCEQKSLLQIRPVFSGTKKAEIRCCKNPQMATVRPNVFPIPKIYIDEGHRVWIKKICGFVHNLEPLQYHVIEGNNLKNSEIIFIGGKGLRNHENYERMVRIAKELGISIGTTRAVVDAGWAPYSLQIGLTGTIVQAKICILFGVSGAEEHVAGIINADCIIAVNLDADADIFRYADVKAVFDAVEVIKNMEMNLRGEIK